MNCITIARSLALNHKAKIWIRRGGAGFTSSGSVLVPFMDRIYAWHEVQNTTAVSTVLVYAIMQDLVQAQYLDFGETTRVKPCSETFAGQRFPIPETGAPGLAA